MLGIQFLALSHICESVLESQDNFLAQPHSHALVLIVNP